MMYRLATTHKQTDDILMPIVADHTACSSLNCLIG